MTALLLAGNHVRANWGRWLIDCSSPLCLSAMQVWPGQPYTACAECGTAIPDLIWPADPEAIEALLSARPDEQTRNWHPGETLTDLLMENAAHGILPPPSDTKQLLVTIDDRLIAGTVGQLLRCDIRRHQIEAATVAEGR